MTPACDAATVAWDLRMERKLKDLEDLLVWIQQLDDEVDAKWLASSEPPIDIHDDPNFVAGYDAGLLAGSRLCLLQILTKMEDLRPA